MLLCHIRKPYRVVSVLGYPSAAPTEKKTLLGNKAEVMSVIFFVSILLFPGEKSIFFSLEVAEKSPTMLATRQGLSYLTQEHF